MVVLNLNIKIWGKYNEDNILELLVSNLKLWEVQTLSNAVWLMNFFLAAMACLDDSLQPDLGLHPSHGFYSVLAALGSLTD